ncbi:MAG TPA: YopJ family acetyltransferase [Roseateles sp.]
MSELAARGAGPSTLPPRSALPLPAARPAFRPAVAARHFPELAGYLQELEQALHEGRTPDTADALHMPELVEGLNLADRSLKLESHLFVLGEPAPVMLQSSLAQRLRDSLGSGQAWRGVISDGDHGAAISLRFSTSSNDVSMLLVDSLAWSQRDVDQKRRAWQAVLATLTPALQDRAGPQAAPVRLHLGMFATDVQRTPEGCHIFALSAAKKLASDPAVAALHERALQGIATGRIRPGVNHLNADRLLPPSLFKHATSGRVVERYVDACDAGRSAAEARRQAGFTGWQRDWPDGQAPVNKQGQNLQQRHAAHSITRESRKAPGRLISYSNSYEAKRIELIREALTHLTDGLN